MRRTASTRSPPLTSTSPVRHVAEPVSAMVVQSWTGKRLAQFDDPSGKPIMHVVWRPDLYRALYDEARRRGITIEHSHRFIDARESGDGVTARFVMTPPPVPTS